jgi:hypothetical protein
VSDSSNDNAERNAAEITDPEFAAAAKMISVDARKVVLLGTALFFAAFVVLLPLWSWLGDHGHRVWLWTALSGTVMGLAALPLIRKHTGEGRLG